MFLMNDSELDLSATYFNKQSVFSAAHGFLHLFLALFQNFWLSLNVFIHFFLLLRVF